MSWAILNAQIQAAVIELRDTTSDRMRALLSGAIAEHALMQALHLRMRKSSVSTEMFKNTGVMGGFAPKIELGYLLYVYDKPMRAALVGLMEIRNVFAHHLDVGSFGDDRLNEAFGKLKMQTHYQKYPAPFWDGFTDEVVGPLNHRRDVLECNLRIILLLLMRDLYSHQIHSNVYVPLLSEPPAEGTLVPPS